LGRRAAGRKLKLDTRYPEEQQVILARKSGEPFAQKSDKPTNGRRRKPKVEE
jgi:hypothetical protein